MHYIEYHSYAFRSLLDHHQAALLLCVSVDIIISDTNEQQQPSLMMV